MGSQGIPRSYFLLIPIPVWVLQGLFARFSHKGSQVPSTVWSYHHWGPCSPLNSRYKKRAIDWSKAEIALFYSLAWLKISHMVLSTLENPRNLIYQCAPEKRKVDAGELFKLLSQSTLEVFKDVFAPFGSYAENSSQGRNIIVSSNSKYKASGWHVIVSIISSYGFYCSLRLWGKQINHFFLLPGTKGETDTGKLNRNCYIQEE